jgi:exopolysaccharide biosynthesis predicted pyruvyltransferase EpsI
MEEIVESEFKLKSFYVMAKRKFTDFEKECIEDCIFPPATAWLRGFMDAEFVVTDSFHGTVFSILFNKPFIAIGNQDRGLARFSSLLKLFNLENRLIQTSTDIDDKLLHEKINWEKVNAILREKKEQSLRFLNDLFYSQLL